MNLPPHIRDMFLEEFETLAAALHHGLLELESSPDPDSAIGELFRNAHSLKGAAQVAGLRPVANVAHAVESILSDLRTGITAPSADVVEQLLVAVDWLAQAAAQMAAGQDPDRRSARTVTEGLAGLLSEGSDGVPAVPSGVEERYGVGVGEASGAGEAQRDHVSQREPDAVRVPAAKLDQVLGYATDVLLARSGLDVLRGDLRAATQAGSEHERHWTALRNELRAMARSRRLSAAGAQLVEEVDASWRATTAALTPAVSGAGATERELRQASGPLAESVLQLRMTPFEHICEGFDRVTRDAARAAGGKHVTLSVDDGNVELDRTVALALREPLIHLLHNAIDHGIEPPDERVAAGKAESGRVDITAELRGGRVAVVVADDGAGIRTAEVRTAAEQLGLAVDEQDAVVAALFTPGLTTAPIVTQTSGRGVGLDAVRTRVEALGGSVDLASEPGRGTTVTLVVPLTLSIVHAVTARIGEQVVALPSAGVERVLLVQPGEVRHVGGWPMIVHEGSHVRLMDLGHVLGMPSPTPEPDAAMPAVLVGSAGAHVAFTVTALLGELDITVHDLGERLRDAPAVLGAALLQTGGLALVLSAAACARLGIAGAPSPTLRRAVGGPTQQTRSRILLAEDTMTTRAMEKGILEAAGYEVATAVDGADAWQQLREHGADLVVSDVNMPRMDGFELCATIRNSRRFADLPVVLVTSLAEQADRRRGIEVGANAYITKSGFDQGLLVQTVERLLQ